MGEDVPRQDLIEDEAFMLADGGEMPEVAFHSAVYYLTEDEEGPCLELTEEDIALLKGEIDPEKEILVRVHSECMTGDIFSSLRCDCQDQLHQAMKMLDEEGSGVILYLRQEGRGIGLVNKLKAYEYQRQGLDTVEANEKLGFDADLRDYGVGAQMLVDLGVKKMRLMTNNPKKMVGLEGYGLSVVEQVAIEVKANCHNQGYLKCKQAKMGHLLHM